MTGNGNPPETLGGFLSRKRGQLQPADVGLPPGHGRRRTPGLRRAEVAERAGISTEYLMCIEQDRGVKPSVAVLSGLADALLMSASERAHLFDLANERMPQYPAPIREVVRPAVLRVLHVLPAPAYVMGRCWDGLAWNESGRLVFGFDEKLPCLDRNLVYMLFVNPLYRELIEPWEYHAKKVIGLLWTDYGRFKHDPHFSDFIEGLKAESKEFAEWWDPHNIVQRPEQPKYINHPAAGRLALEQSVYDASDAPGIRLCVYMPLDSETEERIRSLVDRSSLTLTHRAGRSITLAEKS